jgi:hypothetical protein
MSTVVDDEWWDIRQVCRFFGGSKPVHPSTIYRHIKNRLIDPPDRFGGLSRWRRSRCQANRQAMIDRFSKHEVARETSQHNLAPAAGTAAQRAIDRMPQ